MARVHRVSTLSVVGRRAILGAAVLGAAALSASCVWLRSEPDPFAQAQGEGLTVQVRVVAEVHATQTTRPEWTDHEVAADGVAPLVFLRRRTGVVVGS